MHIKLLKCTFIKSGYSSAVHIMELFKFTSGEKEKTFQLFVPHKNAIERDVEILEEWLKKQPHLPQELPFGNFLEKILLNNKFQIEQCKEKIDAYFTLKALNLYIFEKYTGTDYIKPATSAMTFVALPKLTADFNRVFLVKLNNSDVDYYKFSDFGELAVFNFEMALRYDYSSGVIFILDSKSYTAGHLKKADLVKSAKLLKLLFEGYSTRISALHFINPTPVTSIVVTLLKPVMKDKLFQRIKVHKDLDSFYKHFPREMLTSDYGGLQPSENELRMLTDKAVEENKQLMIDSCKFASIEKLRIGKSKYDDGFGVDGTFKALAID